MEEKHPQNDRKPKQPVCNECEIPKAASLMSFTFDIQLFRFGEEDREQQN